jgi:hypothetical protein
LPRYYLHVRDGVDQMLDPDGSDFPDLDAAISSALAGARELLAADMKSGVLDLRYRMDIENGDGEILHTLSFADAFTCIPAEAHSRTI